MLNKNRPVEVIIDQEKCVKCGLCTKICTPKYLLQRDGDIIVDKDSQLGCFLCGHCMMTCPNDAIIIRGDGLSEKDLKSLPGQMVNYDMLYSLLLNRRSIRKFKRQEIPKEIIDKIINAASTAPIGIPPSEVKVLVINGYQKVDEFRKDILQAKKKLLKTLNPLALTLTKINEGQGQYRVINEFCIPFMTQNLNNALAGNDTFLYDPAAIMVFNYTDISDKEDALIVATLALIAAESLGLGTCPIGPLAPIVERSKEIRSKYGLEEGDKSGLAFIMGYPEVKFKRAIKRHLKDVKYIGS